MISPSEAGFTGGNAGVSLTVRESYLPCSTVAQVQVDSRFPSRGLRPVFNLDIIPQFLTSGIRRRVAGGGHESLKLMWTLIDSTPRLTDSDFPIPNSCIFLIARDLFWESEPTPSGLVMAVKKNCPLKIPGKMSRV
jgi:hypothetical protein